MKKPLLIALILLSTGLTPIVAFSQSATDVINCNKNGLTTASAGSTVPLGGPYVPVADYAVELNTGLLVLKECVLRELAVSKRKAGLATYDGQILSNFNTGNGGIGYASRELGREEMQLGLKTRVRYLENGSLAGFSDVLEGKVKQAIAVGYSNVRDPRKAFVCEYADNGGNLEAMYDGNPIGDYWDAYDAVMYDPACSAKTASTLARNAIENQDAYELYKNRQRLDWGDGIYDAAHYDEYGFRITDTPGKFVGAVALQSITSSYVQAQMADDINEMIDGLYLGVSNQVITGGTAGTEGGLAAITKALGGAVSYMQQVAQRTGGEYAEASANAVIGAIQTALAVEQQFNKAVADTAALFTTTNNQLRAKETQCFVDIAGAVCQTGTVSSSTCTSISGGTLTITKPNPGFAQKVISASILPLTTATIASLNDSTAIISKLEALIAGLRINGSAAAQTLAMASLRAINPHDGAARNAAQQNLSVLGTQMASVLTVTSSTWSENAGWCDVSSQEVKDKWTACWSGNAAACPTP